MAIPARPTGQDPQSQLLWQISKQEEQVKNIRKEYKNNKITYKELAYKNNVGVTLIGYIVNNKIWKHV